MSTLYILYTFFIFFPCLQLILTLSTTYLLKILYSKLTCSHLPAYIHTLIYSLIHLLSFITYIVLTHIFFYIYLSFDYFIYYMVKDDLVNN